MVKITIIEVEEQVEEIKATHDWLLGASPMQTDSSANFTWSASLSMVE